MPKKKVQCPNPLFLQWLEEWKSEAEERSLNSKYTFLKAINSLKKYPLPLNSGQEAKILENVGDGIAKKLDKRLEQYLKNGGSFEDLHRVEIEEPAPKRRRKRRKDPEDEFAVPTSPNMKSPDRAYIPKFRSGPYALLITLYQESKKPTYIGCLTKIELQTLAQPLCDASLTMADPGSHYTAWSSMGILLKKGLVLKWSNPAKFNITSTGCALSEKLLTGTDELFQPGNGAGSSNSSPYSSQQKQNKSQKSRSKSIVEKLPEPGEASIENLQSVLSELNTSKSNKKTYNTTLANQRDKPTLTSTLPNNNSNNTLRVGNHFVKLQEALDRRNKNKAQNSSITLESTNFSEIGMSIPSSSITVNDKRLHFWYVTEKGGCSSLKSQALVTIDDVLSGVGFLIKVKRRDIDDAKITYKIDNSRPSSNCYIFAYICDADAKEIANTPTENETQEPVTIPSSRSKKPNMSSSSTITRPPEQPNKPVHNITTTYKPPACNMTKQPVHPNDIDTAPTQIHRLQTPSIAFELSTNKDIPLKLNYEEILRTRKLQSLFTVYPGSFDIILLVDIVETMGGGKRKKEMAESLMKIGVKLEVRKLQLGDFLWIAKEKFGRQREMILDFILERKRMDDLASSIIDGRFKEQKFRLKSCGLKKLIYLVEEYGSVEHFPVPQTTLKQAVMNTQVIDGMFIKETTSIQDSVEYLRLMTNQLTRIYKDKILHALNMEDIKDLKKESSFEEIIKMEEQHLIQYHEFSSQTDKNKVLSVREMFAKQLMQIKGISAERAVAIVDLYPTPTRLMNALDDQPSDRDKMNLLTNIPFGKCRKKIGLPISRQVFLHYTMLNPPRD